MNRPKQEHYAFINDYAFAMGEYVDYLEGILGGEEELEPVDDDYEPDELRKYLFRELHSILEELEELTDER